MPLGAHACGGDQPAPGRSDRGADPLQRAVQLLAYYTAVAKGTDVDQPRNLAKSVTVEITYWSLPHPNGISRGRANGLSDPLFEPLEQ